MEIRTDSSEEAVTEAVQRRQSGDSGNSEFTVIEESREK
jgi:hypothetical protein